MLRSLTFAADQGWRDAGGIQSTAGIRSDTVWVMDAAAVLRDVRRLAGLSLRELAARAGTSHSTLAAYESGRKTPRVDTLQRICRAAGYSLDVSLTPRLTQEERDATAEALIDLLALADAYPHVRTGPLDAPIFRAATSSA